MIEADLVWEIRATLGEGPIWWKDTLYWVDIEAPALHVYTPATGEKNSYALREDRHRRPAGVRRLDPGAGDGDDPLRSGNG